PPAHGPTPERKETRPEQRFPPRGARHRVLSPAPVRRGGGRVPGHARAVARRRLRALRARPLSREAGTRRGGGRPLQARLLLTADEPSLRGAGPRPRLA